MYNWSNSFLNSSWAFDPPPASLDLDQDAALGFGKCLAFLPLFKSHKVPTSYLEAFLLLTCFWDHLYSSLKCEAETFRKKSLNFFIDQKLEWSESCSVMSDSLWPHWLSWNSPGQNTGVGSLSHFQGIFPTQGSNPGVPNYRQILYQLSHKGNPGTLQYVVYPFSSGISWPRKWTEVSCIAGGFFTSWATREGKIRKSYTNLIPAYF